MGCYTFCGDENPANQLHRLVSPNRHLVSHHIVSQYIITLLLFLQFIDFSNVHIEIHRNCYCIVGTYGKCFYVIVTINLFFNTHIGSQGSSGSDAFD